MKGSSGDAGDRSGWAERAVERLSEDETLRGSLEDDGYGPLLNLAAALAIGRADRVGSVDDLYLAVRQLVVEAVAAAEQGVPTSLIGTTRRLLTADESRALQRAMPPLGRDRNQNAQRIARAISAVTGVKVSGEMGESG